MNNFLELVGISAAVAGAIVLLYFLHLFLQARLIKRDEELRKHVNADQED